MAWTRPIPTEQPLDAAWKAAGQVGAEAVAVQAVAVQAAASFTLAAVLWPPISAAHAMAGLASALGPWLPLRPLPDQPVVVVMPGSGECRTGREGAQWPAGGGARGRCDHAGGRGGVRAPGPVHRRHGAGRPRSGADARRGAGRAARADAVPGGDRNQGVHRPGRPRPRAGQAAAARRGRRGASGLPPGGVRGRAVPHARAGRLNMPAPLSRAGTPVRSRGGRGRHLRLSRARRGALPGPGRPGPGAAAALACAAARRHRQLPDRRRARYRVGQLAVHDPGTLADRGAARGVAGRGRLRHGSRPPHWARRGAG